MEQIHRFEEHGLGKAPFAFVDMFQRVNQDGYPIGTCRYCGNGIKYCYLIRSADGRSFEVGSECVKKTDDEGLKRIVDVAKQDRKRALEMARYQEECAAQRIRNGGKTDHEIECERREAERKTKAEADSKASEWLWSVLQNSTSSFGRGIADNLRRGLETLAMQTPRCLAICKDIYCKMAGRRGSKAYAQAEEEFESKIVS